MALVVTTAGERLLLASLLGQSPLSSVTYRLFSNNYTPQQTDTLAQYTELTLTGYVPIVVSPQAWVLAADSQGGALATAAPLVWNVTAAGPVYGYFVTDPALTTVLWAELIPGGPYNFLADGSSLSIVPSFSAD